MKKVTAILLSLLFFLTSTNYIFLFIERLENIKNQMQEKVSSDCNGNNVTILKFSPNDYKIKLHWHDTNEFELEGKMYDLIRIDERNSELIIYCFNDEKEELLISNFNKLNECRGEQKSFVIVHYQSIVLYAISNDSFLLKIYKNINLQPCISASNYHSVSPDILTPPPRNIV